jgi:hypothetical protein
MGIAFHYSGLVTAAIRRSINGERPINGAEGMRADQDQSNGAYGIKQLRVRLPGDPNVYRILIAPGDAPIMVHGRPIDEHFAQSLLEGLPRDGIVVERMAEEVV